MKYFQGKQMNGKCSKFILACHSKSGGTLGSDLNQKFSLTEILNHESSWTDPPKAFDLKRLIF